MVQFPDSGKRCADSAPPPPAVKLEAEDPLNDEHGPLSKRSKHASPSDQQSLYYNVLEEPGPLGLRLRKSPSLADLIQLQLSKAKSNGASCAAGLESLGGSDNKEPKCSGASSLSSKIKASNFPATLLRIGTWERYDYLFDLTQMKDIESVMWNFLCSSSERYAILKVHYSYSPSFPDARRIRYEGDLVAKCYFAKHKLVWEVLEGGLKSKIEFHWSDITAIKATFSEGGHATLDIVLARPPLFFRETDPQPRKHTLWQATQDFTGGQASIHRRHLLQCAQGSLSKNFEKLLDCDPRLRSLSLQQDILSESHFFEPQYSVLEDQGDSKSRAGDTIKDESGSTFSGFREPGSPYATSSLSNKSEVRDSFGWTPDFDSQDTPSPCSGIEGRSMEENVSKEMEARGQNWWDQLKLPGIRGSMSMTDLVNHLGQHISEQMTSGSSSLSSDAMPNREMLEDIAQYLLNDSQSSAASDEKNILSKVNSLCCLLQKDTVAGVTRDSQVKDSNDTQTDAGSDDEPCSTREMQHVDGAQPPITRKESFGELLILPRIASMPQFLFNIAEDAERETR